ncbi:MAG: acyclic terpene utilization AtuA family protein [Gammaproteobacteria bacterium]|nr:acyclic terpene utilization AtuA family protein [Gammaproteobacteria bacterium]
MKEIKILCPTAALGFGCPAASFEAGLKRKPDVIGVDAGSTDPGPFYLGKGQTILGWGAQKKDLEIYLEAQQKHNIPLIIGSAGGPGSQEVLDETIRIVKEIASDKKYSFKLARIGSDFDKDYLKDCFAKNKIKLFETADELTVEEIDRAEHIVAQMGVEPIIEALKMEADVVIAGRAYDPAVFAALPILKGFDPGLAIHMGQILECGAMAAEPAAGADCLLATMSENSFTVEPLNQERKATIKSVAAHTFYENTNPVQLLFPGGMIDLSETTFEQVNERVVQIAKTRFVQSDQYTLKLEGSKKTGYRTIFIAGVKDPIFIQSVDDIIEQVKNDIALQLPYKQGDDYQIVFHLYGKNAVMGASEPNTDFTPHELGIVGEAIAKTQDIANSVCSFLHKVLLHYPYEGRKQIAGNLAFLYSPSFYNLGEVYEFNIYHLLEVDDPLAQFPITIEELKNDQF